MGPTKESLAPPPSVAPTTQATATATRLRDAVRAPRSIRTGTKRVLAISSGGGHWVQLLRVLPAFQGHDVAFVSVNTACRADVETSRFYLVQDATRWTKFQLLRSAVSVARILRRERPSVVISCGAAPGLLGIFFGKLFGARTIWIDSIANSERLSLSGRIARFSADLWLTQWEHLSHGGQGPRFEGSVL